MPAAKKARRRKKAPEPSLEEWLHSLTEEQLMPYYNVIVPRMKMLKKQRSQQTVKDFAPDDWVAFISKDGECIYARVEFCEKDTVSLIYDYWERIPRVNPRRLIRIEQSRFALSERQLAAIARMMAQEPVLH